MFEEDRFEIKTNSIYDCDPELSRDKCHSIFISLHHTRLSYSFLGPKTNKQSDGILMCSLPRTK